MQFSLCIWHAHRPHTVFFLKVLVARSLIRVKRSWVNFNLLEEIVNLFDIQICDLTLYRLRVAIKKLQSILFP